jgi:hypothetical protein
MFLTALRSYVAVAFHLGPCAQRRRDRNLAASAVVRAPTSRCALVRVTTVEGRAP